MEIINIPTGMSNFQYVSNLCKGRKVLNGFNKLDELMMCESIADNGYNVQNVSFDKEIIADLYIDYPLSVVVKEEIKFNSLHSLIKEIRRTYKKIYKEEERTMSKIKKNNPDLINRGFSNGSFGVWGHDIYDLVIESIKILEGEEKPIVDVSIGS